LKRKLEQEEKEQKRMRESSRSCNVKKRKNEREMKERSRSCNDQEAVT